MFGVGLGIRVGGLITASVGIDADAQAYFDRVTTAGGTLSTNEKNAVNQLVLDLKAYGIWSSMKAIYPMVGASAAACAQNLKSSSFTGSFSSGWTYASTGVTPNGTSAYMNTTLTPNTQTNWITSNHQSFYSRNISNSNVVMGKGNYTNGLELFDLQINTSSTGFVFDSGSFSTGRIIVSGNNSQCFLIGSCTANNLRKLYKNSSLIGTNNNVDNTGVTGGPIYIGAAYNNVTASAIGFSTTECAFSSIGSGLNDTQSANLYLAVQAFQTTLSRQV